MITTDQGQLEIPMYECIKFVIFPVLMLTIKQRSSSKPAKFAIKVNILFIQVNSFR